MNLLDTAEEFAAPNLWMGAGILFLVMLSYIGFLEYRINSLKKDVAEITLIADRNGNALEQANTSIDQLKKNSDRATAQGLKALKEAQKQTIASNKRLNDLRDKADNAKTCDESVDVAKEML